MTTAPAHPGPPAIEEPQYPYPPRFWWLKRGGAAFVALLLLMLALRLWWGREAERRYQELVAAAHAQNQPALREDLRAAPVPIAQNAAISLDAAAKAIIHDNNFDNLQTIPNYGLLTPSELNQAQAVLALNQKPLQLCRLARSQPGVDWQIPLTSPVILGKGLNYLSQQRELSTLEGWSILYDHAVGNDAGAIEGVRDMLRQADAIGKAPSVTIVELVVVGLRASATQKIELIAPDLQTDDHAPATTRRNPASRAQVAGLIADLLDERELCRMQVRSWYGEGASNLDLARSLFSKVTGQTWLPWTLEPITTLDGINIYRDSAAVGVAVEQTNWQAAASRLPRPSSSKASPLEFAVHFYSRLLGGSHRRAVQVFYEGRAQQRVAALRLAIRLYRIDHDGHYPARLQELVPAYLPAVPLDPMAADGRPLAYLPNRVPPAIYSVGLNGLDDGGSTLGPAVEPWRSDDAVFPLEPEPPTPPAPATTAPSPQTENDK